MGRPKKSGNTEEKKLTNSDCPCKSCKNNEVNVGDGIVSPEELLKAATDAGVFVYDIETTNIFYSRGRIEGIGFYVPPIKNNKKPVHAWYPFTENSFVKYVDGVPTSIRPAMPHAETMDALRCVLENPDLLKIAANGKFDDSWLQENPGTEKPILVCKPKGDSMLADYISDERRRRYGLKIRVNEVFGHIMTTYEEASQRQGTFAFMNQKPLGQYGLEDCYWCYRLHQHALEEMKRQDPSGKLEKIYWNIEMPLRDIIVQIETTGILLDYDHLLDLADRLEQQKAEILKEIINTAGWAPNLRSPSQVSDFLYNSPEDGGLGLPTDGLEEGADGSFSTSEKVIAHFGRKDKLVDKLLKYRSLEVIDRSFCQKLIKIAQEDGRVRAGFSQTGTVIGRLSSSRPCNMQNMPREKNMIRKAFVAQTRDQKDSDIYFINADLSQIELRVAASLANEKNMLEVYQSGTECPSKCDRFVLGHECKEKTCKWEGNIVAGVEKCGKCGSSNIEYQARCRHMDLHQRTAEDVKVPRNPIAKSANFSLLYRVGAPKFMAASDLYDKDGNPQEDYAREIIQGWHAAYPQIKNWHFAVEEQLKKDNWIATNILGRKRRLDVEKKFNEFKAVTQGIQFLVSGLAQDILKLGMIRIYDYAQNKIKNGTSEERKLWARFKFVTQVHDELMWECPLAILKEAKVMVKSIVESVAKLKAPIVFAVKSSPKSWEDCH